MKYNLQKNIDIQRLKTMADKLIELGSFVELKKINPKRSNQQSRYLHLILSYFATEYGESTEYIKQELFKKVVNKEIFKTEYANKKTGEVRMDWKSSAILDTGELTTAIDRFRNYASKEAGIYLPEPNEHEFLKHCEIEIDRNKLYL